MWQPGTPVRTPNDLECKLAELLREIEAGGSATSAPPPDPGPRCATWRRRARVRRHPASRAAAGGARRLCRRGGPRSRRAGRCRPRTSTRPSTSSAPFTTRRGCRWRRRSRPSAPAIPPFSMSVAAAALAPPAGRAWCGRRLEVPDELAELARAVAAAAGRLAPRRPAAADREPTRDARPLPAARRRGGPRSRRSPPPGRRSRSRRASSSARISARAGRSYTTVAALPLGRTGLTRPLRTPEAGAPHAQLERRRADQLAHVLGRRAAAAGHLEPRVDLEQAQPHLLGVQVEAGAEQRYPRLARRDQAAVLGVADALDLLPAAGTAGVVVGDEVLEHDPPARERARAPSHRARAAGGRCGAGCSRTSRGRSSRRRTAAARPGRATARSPPGRTRAARADVSSTVIDPTRGWSAAASAPGPPATSSARSSGPASHHSRKPVQSRAAAIAA